MSFAFFKVHQLAEQIGQKLAKAEQLGAEGFVDESMKMMEEVSLLGISLVIFTSMKCSLFSFIIFTTWFN